MLPKDIDADYFVWYNPENRLYESGSIEKFESVSAGENTEDQISLILKFSADSHHIADKIVLELNAAKERMGLP